MSYLRPPAPPLYVDTSGPVVTAAEMNWLDQKAREVLSPLDENVDTTGVSDATTAFQAGLNALPSGGTYHIPGTAKIRINSNITVPPGVQITGDFNASGAAQNGSIGPTNFTNFGSAILLAPTATITMQAGSGIKGCVIYNPTLSYPTLGSGGFSGTAITVTGDDVYVGYTMIAGYAKAIFSNGSQRHRFEFVIGDNNAGIEITACADVPKIQLCHFWPFASYQFSSFTAKVDNGSGSPGNTLTVTGATTGPALAVGAYVGTVGALITALGTYNSSTGGTLTIGGAAQLVSSEPMTSSPFQLFARTGDAIYLHDTVDGPQVVNNFAFGYLNGLHTKNISTLHATGNFFDNTLTHTGSSGMLFEGGLNTASVVGNGCWSSQYGVNVNLTAMQILLLTSQTVANVQTYGVWVQSGDVSILNSEFLTLPTVLNVAITSSIVEVAHTKFAQISSTPVILGTANTTAVFWGPGNVWVDGTAGQQIFGTSGSNNYTLPPVTAAATLALLPWDIRFHAISGATQVNTITGGWPMREITFYATGAVSFGNNAGADQILLAGSATASLTTGSSITFIHNGFGWVEKSRSIH